MPNNNFVKPLFWGTSNFFDCHGLKRVLALKKPSHFDGQNGQKMPETCDEIFLDPKNPFLV